MRDFRLIEANTKAKVQYSLMISHLCVQGMWRSSSLHSAGLCSPAVRAVRVGLRRGACLA